MVIKAGEDGRRWESIVGSAFLPPNIGVKGEAECPTE